MTEKSISYKSKYVLKGQINQRNMPHFTIYKAIQAGLEREVEIRIFKVKNTGEGTSALKRFEREYQILAKLDHPNIIKILDLGTEQDRGYYVTDLRKSKSISELLNEKLIIFEAEEVLKMGKEVGKALSYIHKRSLLHRDISSDNIFYDIDNNFYYIGSFSQGKEVIDKDVTARGIPFISPLIATPEILGGLPVDSRTDIYLLGRLMYNLLTGQKNPVHYSKFEKDTLDITSLDARPIKEFNPEIPSSVDILIRKMISHSPTKRFQNCDEFLKELDTVRRKLESIKTLRFNQEELVKQRLEKRKNEIKDNEEKKSTEPPKKEKHTSRPLKAPSFSFDEISAIFEELPSSLKYGLLLSLIPIGIMLFSLFSSPSDSGNAISRRTSSKGSRKQPTVNATSKSALKDILAISDKTSEKTFLQRYNLIAKYRRSFPHKERKNIVSYNNLIEARVAFYKDATEGCSIIDKIIDKLHTRNKD